MNESPHFDALGSWVQKVVDLVRDVSREVEGVRAEVRTAITEVRHENGGVRDEMQRRLERLIERLDSVERVVTARVAADITQAAHDDRRWQIWLAVVAAILAVIGNVIVWFQTRDIQSAVTHNANELHILREGEQGEKP